MVKLFSVWLHLCVMRYTGVKVLLQCSFVLLLLFFLALRNEAFYMFGVYGVIIDYVIDAAVLISLVYYSRPITSKHLKISYRNVLIYLWRRENVKFF